MSDSFSLPLQETLEPSTADELADILRDATSPVYPLGGRTSLDYGLPVSREGVGLSLASLRKIIDYPHRDMTITVEAGTLLSELSQALAEHGQRLPWRVPQADRATVGGIVATNFNGPLRCGCGAVRDHVIGISAVNGLGETFRGGGRVVKNVAGYDFCKLLTGSLGVLGVITQVTLKLTPIPADSVVAVCRPTNWEQTERVLNSLAASAVPASAIELLGGPYWERQDLSPSGPPSSLWVAVVLEGAETEVHWMVRQIRQEWQQAGASQASILRGSDAERMMGLLTEFPQAEEAPLTLKASLAPSGTAAWIREVLAIDPQCSLQAHAGNGTVIARFSEFPAEGLSRAVIGKLQPAAAAQHGRVVVLSNPSGAEATRQCVWGVPQDAYALMAAIKQRFDPRNILNPGRMI